MAKKAANAAASSSGALIKQIY